MITYCPLNARSELMSLVNCPWGGVLDTWRKFQIADPASNRPGFKPTLGSGLGAAVDMWAPPAQAMDDRAIAAANEKDLITTLRQKVTCSSATSRRRATHRKASYVRTTIPERRFPSSAADFSGAGRD